MGLIGVSNIQHRISGFNVYVYVCMYVCMYVCICVYVPAGRRTWRAGDARDLAAKRQADASRKGPFSASYLTRSPLNCICSPSCSRSPYAYASSPYVCSVCR
jgi:hypothetical protein